MAQIFKIPLVLSPQPEGGYTVTNPLSPELITEGDTPQIALAHVEDALDAVLELYEDLRRPIPAGLRQAALDEPIRFESVVARP